MSLKFNDVREEKFYVKRCLYIYIYIVFCACIFKAEADDSALKKPRHVALSENTCNWDCVCLFEICALLGYYAASYGNCLPTFRDNVSVPSSRVKSPNRIREDGTDTFFRNVVNNYHITLRNIPEERRYHQHRGGSLKSRSVYLSILYRNGIFQPKIN
jgi:hypothetical protein